MSNTVIPKKRRGRPKGSYSHKQFMTRLRKLRQVVDPKNQDPFWRKLETICREHHNMQRAKVPWLKLTRDIKSFLRSRD